MAVRSLTAGLDDDGRRPLVGEIQSAEDDGRRTGGHGDGRKCDLHAEGPSQPQRVTPRPGSTTEPTGAYASTLSTAQRM